MKLRLERYGPHPDSTLGTLSVDGELLCWTLEDEIREIEGEPVEKWKVKGETAIPRGNYTVVINFSNRFQREMPQLLDVPGFSGIRIHPGNTDKDTDGCILVGGKPLNDNFLPSSRQTFSKLFDILLEAELNGESIKMEVV